MNEINVNSQALEKINDDVVFFRYGENAYFHIDNNEINLDNYDNFSIDFNYYHHQKNGILIKIPEKRVDLSKFIFSIKDKDYDWEVFLKEFDQHIISKNEKSKIKMFLGDFSELAFMYQYGGSKEYEASDSDVFLDGEHYEIKTLNRTKKEVIISSNQLANKVHKVIVEIVQNNDGMTISELASKVKRNYQFKKIIAKKYEGNILSKWRWEIKAINKWIAPLAPNLPDDFTKAKYSIKVRNEDLVSIK